MTADTARAAFLEREALSNETINGFYSDSGACPKHRMNDVQLRSRAARRLPPEWSMGR